MPSSDPAGRGPASHPVAGAMPGVPPDLSRPGRGVSAPAALVGFSPFAGLLLSAGGRMFPPVRAHLPFPGQPGRWFFTGRSAASPRTRSAWQTHPHCGRSRVVHCGSWASLPRAVRTGPPPYRAAAVPALGFASLRMADTRRAFPAGSIPAGTISSRFPASGSIPLMGLGYLRGRAPISNAVGQSVATACPSAYFRG